MDEILAANKKEGTIRKTEKGQFKTDYGYFSEDGREYFISRPDTPMPWINVVSNPEYGFVISQTGAGFSWYKNANLSRINRWEQDLITDSWGKFIYIRDDESREFWSVSWKPCKPKFKNYRVSHGIGYSKINSLYGEIEANLTLFVPPGESLELWRLSLRNLSSRKRHISLFSYIELSLGNALDPHREFQKTFIETEYDAGLWAILGKKRKIPVPGYISSGLAEWPISCFHSVNMAPVSYEGEKRNFLGMYNSLKSPAILREDKLTNTVGKWFDSIASLHIRIELAPLEERVVVFTLGSTEKEEQAKALMEKYRNLGSVDKAFEETLKFWDQYLSALVVETPDSAFNFMTNNWLKYQAISGRLWARTAYYQSSGAYGFRDQLQDSLVFLPLRPEETKKQILLHARHQFRDGTVYHWWHNLLDKGAHTQMSDNLLWLVFLTLAYLDETQDISILGEKVDFVDAPPEPLYSHCVRAIERVLSRFSPRGLPLIGAGDWNDGLSSVGLSEKGESIWLAHFLYGILNRFASISERQNDAARARLYRERAKELKENINKFGWDGRWYIRATKDNGEVIGSSGCEEGKIFLNAQTWAVINETATEERAKQAMDSVEALLLKDYGPLLLYPAYTHPDKEIGYLTRYAPGLRENGGVYTHAACWAIIAEVILRRPERAYEIYSKICPIKRAMEPEVYLAEPYVTCGNTDGPQSAYYGRGGWSWYTGSAAWLFRLCGEWILGVRPVEEGLLISPCIPKEWWGFKMKRIFRNATYEIEVENPGNVSFGVKEIYVDGNLLEKPIIPAFSDGKVHSVRVIMG